MTGATVVDLFCGAGGLTQGFVQEEFTVAAGIDIDEACRFPFEKNNNAPFLRRNVSRLSGRDILPLFATNYPKILVGCAPCQPFSTYNQKNDDPKWKLLSHFGTLITEVGPDIVSMENVPQLVRFQNGKVFRNFVSQLERAGYSVSSSVVFAPGYGVPQRRYRLVLLASRFGEIELEPPSYSPDCYPTVGSAIGHLPALEAGEIDSMDSLHRASGLSAINLLRIRAARPGGSWRDWDENLVAKCHKASSGKTYGAVYGRMVWDAPSPTITTQFFGFGSGRFGHPEQDRALSLREGAILQSFPPAYEFVAPGQGIYFKRVGPMIGNAVPVLLGRAIARSIKRHLTRYC